MGSDAASELAGILETVEATRGDVAELRHEMRRELDVIKVRLGTMSQRFDTVATKADLHAAMWTQTRWLLAGLVTVLLAIYFRT